YTRVEFAQRELGVSRITATRYLDALAADGLLDKIRVGRNNYYVNRPLFDQLRRGDEVQPCSWATPARPGRHARIETHGPTVISTAGRDPPFRRSLAYGSG